jgi:hypothetical protein
LKEYSLFIRKIIDKKIILCYNISIITKREWAVCNFFIPSFLFSENFTVYGRIFRLLLICGVFMPSLRKTVSLPKKERVKKAPEISYQPEFCEQLLQFFDVPPFHITEIQKRDGTISLLETACELPTFAAFAKKIGTTCSVLAKWENTHPSFKEAAQKARDLQSNILIQNSLRGNYSSSFAMFTAKNLLGWKDGKEEGGDVGPLVISWEEK